MKTLSTLWLLAAALAPAQAVIAQDGGPPPTSVNVEAAKVETLQERRRVTGALRAVARSLVATHEPGLVVELRVEEGDRVKQGDILAVLEHQRLDIALRQLEAEAEVAKAVLAARAAELDMEVRDQQMLRELDARRASNPKELADADAQLAIAGARRDEAQRRLEVIESRAALVQQRIDDTTITAPFDGVVIDTQTEAGQWVAEGDGLVEVVSVGTYDAWLDVPQRYATAVRRSTTPLRIQIDATGETRTAEQSTIVPRVDPTARTFPVYCRIEDSEGVLAAGMSVTGWVPTGKEGSFVTVPRDALLRNQAGFFVYVARGGPGGGFSAAPTPISILFETQTSVAIEGRAIAAGDLVVVEGNERLFPMMPIAFETDTPGGGT